MPALGQKQAFCLPQGMSALPPKPVLRAAPLPLALPFIATNGPRRMDTVARRAIGTNPQTLSAAASQIEIMIAKLKADPVS
jgi:hypothetical protein